jgi:hypothetical protein
MINLLLIPIARQAKFLVPFTLPVHRLCSQDGDPVAIGQAQASRPEKKSHDKQKEKQMSRLLRMMAMVGTLGLGVTNLPGVAATPQASNKQAAATATQSSPAQPANSTASKKKASKHHSKQNHQQHSQTMQSAQPTGSATAAPKK